MAEPSPVTGAFNFRDLGGLRTTDGRTLRPGLLLRSDTLQALTATDVRYLVHELRLELVVDLRIGPEAVGEGRGPLVETPVCYLNAPLRDLSPEPGLAPDAQTLRFYLDHLGSPTSPLATVVRVLCAQAGHPVLVHCAAGKDRTGLVIALLLRLLGVRDSEIVADYLRTATNMDRIMQRFLGWPRYREHMARVPAEVYRAQEHTIVGFLEGLDREHGGAHGWAQARGIGEPELTTLRTRLLTAG
ncbi:tyrosine-protein phosphatase [Nakamurella sp.]|uniref:tyrosine-protein phosphatase n=1 Tax=Nakamurella sp. TaxID=1869182 RepID=UPI00378308B3